jgi:hypothetical protein
VCHGGNRSKNVLHTCEGYAGSCGGLRGQEMSIAFTRRTCLQRDIYVETLGIRVSINPTA